jgi:hypothetical protein
VNHPLLVVSVRAQLVEEGAGRVARHVRQRPAELCDAATEVPVLFEEDARFPGARDQEIR